MSQTASQKAYGQRRTARARALREVEGWAALYGQPTPEIVMVAPRPAVIDDIALGKLLHALPPTRRNPKMARSCVYTDEHGNHCVAGELAATNGGTLPPLGSQRNRQSVTANALPIPEDLSELFGLTLTRPALSKLAQVQEVADGLRWPVDSSLPAWGEAINKVFPPTPHQRARQIVHEAADWLDAHPERWTTGAIAERGGDLLMNRRGLRLLEDPTVCLCAEGVITSIDPTVYANASFLSGSGWWLDKPVAGAVYNMLGPAFYTFNDHTGRTVSEVAAEMRRRADAGAK